MKTDEDQEIANESEENAISLKNEEASNECEKLKSNDEVSSEDCNGQEVNEPNTSEVVLDTVENGRKSHKSISGEDENASPVEQNQTEDAEEVPGKFSFANKARHFCFPLVYFQKNVKK